MSKVKIQGNASGTGVLTVTAPNTSTDRTITLPDSTGSLIADDGSGKVGIGTNSPTTELHIENASQSVANRVAYNGTYYTDYGYYIVNTQSNDFVLKTTGTTRMTVKNDTGYIIAANGVTFGTDTAAANALDDYEEGSFTPTMDIEGSGSVTLSASYGYYVKIGSFVSARLDMQVSAISGAGSSDAWEWAGLPFAVNASNNGYTPISGIRVTGMASEPNALTGFVTAGSSGGRIEAQTSSTANSSTLLSSTTRVQMTFIYQV